MVRLSFLIEFDKTAVIGGFQQVTRTLNNSGLPILRSVPVLQWFVGEQSEGEEKMDLLILACPRISQESSDKQIEIPVTKQVTEKVKVVDSTNAEYKEDQKKYSGWLYWLNWFVW